MEAGRFETYMTAATFAEAGEHDTAREMLQAGKGRKPAPSPAVKKPYLKTLVFGAISLTAYMVLFTNQKWVMGTFTHGGWYAVFPVGTAFLFSFIHGAFASNLLSSLSLEAKK